MTIRTCSRLFGGTAASSSLGPICLRLIGDHRAIGDIAKTNGRCASGGSSQRVSELSCGNTFRQFWFVFRNQCCEVAQNKVVVSASYQQLKLVEPCGHCL